MRNLYYILQKEFLLILHDKTMLRLILIVPVLELLLIPLAADYEVKHVSLAVLDQDHTAYSRRLVEKAAASSYFQLAAVPRDQRAARALFERRSADLVLTIPRDFERDLITSGRARLQLEADAVNGVRAGLGTSYALGLVRQFQQELAPETPMARSAAAPVIEVTSAAWYNPHGDYPLFMVPGVLAILVTLVGAFLSAINIVQEKEAGIIEQINVTPIRKYQFILGKLIPFWVAGMGSMTLGIGLALVVYRQWPAGSLATIYAFAALYLVGVLGLGFFISTITDSQQQAMLLSFFLIMVFALLGGLYTPIESMPGWARVIAAFNPPSHFIAGLRAVYIKGSTARDLLWEWVWLVGFAVSFNTLAIWSYRKRSA